MSIFMCDCDCPVIVSILCLPFSEVMMCKKYVVVIMTIIQTNEQDLLHCQSQFLFVISITLV